MLTLSLNRESRTPLQLQIFQFYFQAIQQGDLLCGDKLPSIREQAQTLNVAKITIVMAYEKLMTAGFIKSRQGIGYEVIFTAPVRSPPTHVTSAEGSPPAFRAMLDTMNHGGRIAMLGIPPSDMSVDWTKVIFKGLFIKGIYGREMFETWYKMAALIQSGLDLSPIITHRFSIDEFQQGFDAMRSGQSGKVILSWD